MGQGSRAGDFGSLCDSMNRLGAWPSWEGSIARVVAEWEQVSRYRTESTSTYGYSVLPGHLDHLEVAPGRLEEWLLSSHALPTSGFGQYSSRQVRWIGYTKINQLAMGGTGISPLVFERLMEVVQDPDFEPSVPRCSSYSSGDVIPAAHWALDALGFLQGGAGDYCESLLPGDSMALMNGSFVSVGLSCALLERVKSALDLLASRAATGEQTYRSLTQGQNVQMPVSLRAVNSVMESGWSQLRVLERACLGALERQSGNPLYQDGRPRSQASFLDFETSFAVSGVTEWLLLFAWSATQRTKHIAIAAQKSLSADESNGTSMEALLRMSQIPKLGQAQLERMRHEHGMRPFASGGETSKGIEDLWSYGLMQVEAADLLLDQVLLLSDLAQQLASVGTEVATPVQDAFPRRGS